MTREKFAWLVSIVLLAALAFQIPGTLAQRDDDYAWVRTLVQIHRQVDDNYVDPVKDDDLKNKAIAGMLGSLDPFTQYIPEDKTEAFQRAIGGTFKGVGISLQKRGDKITVVTPLEGSPADKAGIHAGDVIEKVDGKPIAGLDLDAVSSRVVGPIGTPVTLTMLRNDSELDFTMQRKQIVLPTVLGYDRNPDDSWKYFVSDNPKVAYVRITQFDDETFDELQRTLTGPNGLVSQGMQGLILDLRFNGGGLLDRAVSIINMFLPKDKVIVTTRGRNRPEDIK